jgi:hypothetical protein
MYTILSIDWARARWAQFEVPSGSICLLAPRFCEKLVPTFSRDALGELNV